MKDSATASLAELAKAVEEYLLPSIQASSEACSDSHKVDDEFFDNYTYGTSLWKNLWNRILKVIEDPKCPFEKYGKGNEYKLKYKSFILSHHKIDDQTRIPNGAKSSKRSACQLSGPTQLPPPWPRRKLPIVQDNIIIAIGANHADGLLEVFVGALIATTDYEKGNRSKYKWTKEHPVYLAEGAPPSSAPYYTLKDKMFLNSAPEEITPDLRLQMDETKQGVPPEEEARVETDFVDPDKEKYSKDDER